MFGKIFASMYDGSLATRGPWQALVTFQQLIVLADRTGIVDMTAETISRRTTIPLDIIRIGISALEQPDSESRTPALDGRRITRLSDTRDWGWQIVNYDHYRKMRSADERREYMANLMREKRLKEKSGRKQPLAKLAHVDVDADVEAINTKTVAPSGAVSVNGKKRKTTIPPDFGSNWSPSMTKWLEGESQVKAHLIHFTGYAKANGKQYADWEQAFQNAIRDDWAGVRKAGL